MHERTDVAVIGSGFGGAVTACRLAEHGYRVVVLERGRRWSPANYPRNPADAWFYDTHRPEHANGWIDLRLFGDMAVAQGAGVGGGSLIYANILVEAEADLFRQGWPPEITAEVLAPYYRTVGEMLDVQRVPDNQWPRRTSLMRDAAAAVGHGDRFRMLELGVTFDPQWSYDLPDAHDERHAKPFTNRHGVEQRTCVHLGNCDIGCDVQAKNTLDLNYLAVAERHGAEIRPLHVVHRIEQLDGGYRVSYDRLADGARQPGVLEARIVVLAAGSLGSTELLLRQRDEHGTLPAVSDRLGVGWSSNGDFLTPAIYPDREISPTRGPTITSAIDFLDGAVDGQHFFIEDGGFPDVLGDFLRGGMRDWSTRRGWRPWRIKERALKLALRRMLDRRNPLPHLMPWFAQGRDAANGRLRLRRRWFGLAGPKQLWLDWDVRASEPVMDAIVAMHRRLAHATDGDPLVPPTWTWAKWLITPHPLGGCHMGTTADDGVVDHLGEVFGYRNLYVADGSIIPEAIGANPSKTIAALAERIAESITQQGR